MKRFVKGVLFLIVLIKLKFFYYFTLNDCVQGFSNSYSFADGTIPTSSGDKSSLFRLI